MPPQPSSAFLSVRLPQATRDRLKAAAAARGQTVQGLVGGLVERFLADATRKPPDLASVQATLRAHAPSLRRRGTRQRLDDIRAAAEDARAFAGGLDAAAFAALPAADRRTYRALKNALAEIGEAVKLLPPELLARHPGVDWRGWAGLRDLVPHQYLGSRHRTVLDSR